jgi:hypothetical protein
MLSRYDYTPNPHLHKRTRLVSYKYTIGPLEEKFTILIFYCIHIFRAFLSKIFFYFLFLKK